MLLHAKDHLMGDGDQVAVGLEVILFRQIPGEGEGIAAVKGWWFSRTRRPRGGTNSPYPMERFRSPTAYFPPGWTFSTWED